MADNDVIITFAARATDLLATLDKTARSIEKNQEELKKVKKAGDEASGGFEKGVMSAAKFTAGVLGVSSAMSTLVEHSRQVRDNTEQAADKMNELNRQFQIQSGLRGVQAEEAQNRIRDLATKNAVSNEVANKAAVALASGGFSSEEASGGALDALLQGMQASLKGGEDPTALAQSSGQFLAAMGMTKDAKNMKRVMVASQQLFKTTDFQISDLTNLASKSQGAAGIMSPEEVLGTFNVMRDKTSADVASTGFKILLERLQTAKGDPQSVQALGRMGLKAGDVDLQGENMQTVLDRLSGGLDKLKPEDRPVIMEKLFGREALSPITGLIRDRGKIAGNIAAMGNEAAFNADVDAATEGPVARKQRLANEEENRRAKGATGFKDRMKATREEAIARGESELTAGIRETVASEGATLLSTVLPKKLSEDLAQRFSFAGAGENLLTKNPFSAAYGVVKGSVSDEFYNAADKRFSGAGEAASKQPIIVNVKVEAPKGARAVPAAAGLGAAERAGGR